MVWSVLQQTLNKVVSCVCYWLRRRSRGGEVEREEGWGQRWRGIRIEAAASLHSFTRFLHMMRRPWIDASRLWGDKHKTHMRVWAETAGEVKLWSRQTAHVCIYLEVPNGHSSIDTCGAELATIPFVSLIDRHLAKRHRHIWTSFKGWEVRTLKL